MTIGSVLARIGEIQSRFGFSTGVGSPVVDAGSFSGLSPTEIVDVVAAEAEKIAGEEVASALAATVADALAVHRGDAGFATDSVAGGLDDAVSPQTLEFNGGAVYPLAGFDVGSAFGPRTDPIDGTPKMHKGIDIAAPTGTPIGAAASGTVTWAGPRGTYGNLVVISHGSGNETRYAHQSDVLVNVGDRVAAGQQIGAVGSTGRSTGPHLHFEARVDGTAVDPVEWLSLNS